MKDGKFEVGDEVECVDDTNRKNLKNGEVYTMESISIIDNDCINIKDKSGHISGGYYSRRFKLVEPDFQREYFTALNEKEAEKYVGLTMEFASSPSVRENNEWIQDIFISFGYRYSPYPFTAKAFGASTFMRTCPETFQKKKVKKIYEQWVNIYPSGRIFHYRTEEIADKNAMESRGTCLHIRKEYEVEE